jgi:hypothetical protein
MELVSMIANEKFTDRPRCACVVIGAFLRGWNDRSGHAERQALRPYAKRVVGSRASRSVTRRRRDVCLTWAGADLTGNFASRMIRRLGMRLRILALLGIRPALRLNDGAGDLAARTVFARCDPVAGLRLIDTLLAVGTEAEDEPGPGDHDDALTRAVVERAVRNPAPLPEHGAGRRTNGHNGHNGHANGAESGVEVPARVRSKA